MSSSDSPLLQAVVGRLTRFEMSTALLSGSTLTRATMVSHFCQLRVSQVSRFSNLAAMLAIGLTR